MAEKCIMKCSCHGAVVITRGKIVGRGFNRYLERVNKKKAFSLHAEVSAIQDALRSITLDELSQSVLVIVRINKDGETIYSYPCDNCKKYILEKKLKTVYYS